MKDHEQHPPLVITRGEGVYLYDDKGKKYIDAVSSWWVNIHGHAHPRLNRALKEQVDALEQVIFSGFTHAPGVELAERLVKILPKNITKIFYSDDGSTAVEVALKMALQYWQHKGRPEKTKFASLQNGYHGDTVGAMSVGGVDLFQKTFKPLLFETRRAASPYGYRCPLGKECKPCDAECISSLENILREHHKEIAAFIVEPLIQAAGGMILYPEEYLQKAARLCRQYEVLLICDEVMTGFGRTGEMFASERAGISPDMMCLSKGLTAGYLPMAATAVTEEVYGAFYDDYDTLKTFFHGHSFTGNPLAAAVGVESLKIFEEENVLERNKPLQGILRDGFDSFRDYPCVGDVRTLGMVGAVELVKNKKTKEPFDVCERIGLPIYEGGLKEGVILRPLGNVVYILPPYVITEEELSYVLRTLGGLLKKLRPGA
jgi:adenosylmethionine-8-amino-7-oxononanoate aminotransferase